MPRKAGARATPRTRGVHTRLLRHRIYRTLSSSRNYSTGSGAPVSRLGDCCLPFGFLLQMNLALGENMTVSKMEHITFIRLSQPGIHARCYQV